MNNNGNCQLKSPCKFYHPSSACSFWKAGKCTKGDWCPWPHFEVPKSQANLLLTQATSQQPKAKAKGKAKSKAKAKAKRNASTSQPSDGSVGQPQGKAKAKAKSKANSNPSTPRHSLVNTLNQTDTNIKAEEKKLRKLRQKKKATQRALSQGNQRVAIGVPVTSADVAATSRDNASSRDAPPASNPFGAGSMLAAPVHLSPLNP